MLTRICRCGPVAGLALLSGALGAQSPGYPSPNYEVTDSVVVGHVDGHLFTLDVVNRRLYGSGNAVVDVDGLKVVSHVADSTPGESYLVAAETDRGITSNGDVFGLGSGAMGQHVAAHVKGLAYDPVTRRAFLLGDTVTVLALAPLYPDMQMTRRQQGTGGGGGGGGGNGGYGGGYGGGMNGQVVPGGSDTARRNRAPAVRLTATLVGTFSLPGAAGWGVTDGRGQIYIALTSRDSLAIVDAQKLKVESIAGLSSCRAPTSLAIDNLNHRLFAACDGQIVVFATDRDHVTGVVDVPGHADQIAFSSGGGLLFVPGGDHGLSVLHRDSPDTYRIVQTVTDPRVLGANAVVFDPTTHRLFVPHRTADGVFTYYILSRPL